MLRIHTFIAGMNRWVKTFRLAQKIKHSLLHIFFTVCVLLPHLCYTYYIFILHGRLWLGARYRLHRVLVEYHQPNYTVRGSTKEEINILLCYENGSNAIENTHTQPIKPSQLFAVSLHITALLQYMQSLRVGFCIDRVRHWKFYHSYWAKSKVLSGIWQIWISMRMWKLHCFNEILLLIRNNIDWRIHSFRKVDKIGIVVISRYIVS